MSSPSSSNSGAALYEKGKIFMSKRDSDLKKKREEQLAKIAAETTFKPEITDAAKKIKKSKDFSTYAGKWKQKVDREVQSKKEQLELEQQKKIEQSATKMSSKTKEYLEKTGHQGPISNWQQHFEYYEKRVNQKPEEGGLFFKKKSRNLKPNQNSTCSKKNQTTPPGSTKFQRLS